MERRYIKAINFDLDTKLLNEYHPTGDYHRAYYDLKRFFNHHNFTHKQGSGYVSKLKLNSQDIFILIDDLCKEFSWISECVKEFDVTNVGPQYGLVDTIRDNKSDNSFVFTI